MEAEIRLIQQFTAMTKTGEAQWQIVNQQDGPPNLMTLDGAMPTPTGMLNLKLVVVLFKGGGISSPDHPVSSRFTLSVDDQQGGTSFAIRADRTDTEEALFDLYLAARSAAERSKVSAEAQAEALLARLRPVPQQ